MSDLVSPENAKQRFLAEAICWQRNARHEYEKAEYYKEQWLYGCVNNLEDYEIHMSYAFCYSQQAQAILFLLIGR